MPPDDFRGCPSDDDAEAIQALLGLARGLSPGQERNEDAAEWRSLEVEVLTKLWRDWFGRKPVPLTAIIAERSKGAYGIYLTGQIVLAPTLDPDLTALALAQLERMRSMDCTRPLYIGTGQSDGGVRSRLGTHRKSLDQIGLSPWAGAFHYRFAFTPGWLDAEAHLLEMFSPCLDGSGLGSRQCNSDSRGASCSTSVMDTLFQPRLGASQQILTLCEKDRRWVKLQALDTLTKAVDASCDAHDRAMRVLTNKTWWPSVVSGLTF